MRSVRSKEVLETSSQDAVEVAGDNDYDYKDSVRLGCCWRSTAGDALDAASRIVRIF